MTDRRLEEIVAALLRTGVILAAVVVLAGGIWYLSAAQGLQPSYRSFQPTAAGWKSLGSLPGPERLILIGLLLLVATPVVRVGFAMVAFALERDWAYVWITVIVLVVLLYSIGTAIV